MLHLLQTQTLRTSLLHRRKCRISNVEYPITNLKTVSNALYNWSLDIGHSIFDIGYSLKSPLGGGTVRRSHESQRSAFELSRPSASIAAKLAGGAGGEAARYLQAASVSF